MKLLDFIGLESVFLDIKVQDKEQLLTDLAYRIAQDHDFPVTATQLLVALKEREHLASTCVSKEVAIPHAKLSGSFCPQVFFARSLNKISFDESFEHAVQLFFVVIVPESITFAQMKILCKIEQLCRDKVFLEKLVEAKTPHDILGAVELKEARGVVYPLTGSLG